MKRFILGLGIIAVLASSPITLAADEAQPVRVEMQDGSVWRGQTGAEVKVSFKQRGQRRVVEGTLARYTDGWLELTGPSGKRLAPVFAADIIRIEQIGDGTGSSSSAPVKDPGGDSEADASDSSSSASEGDDKEVDLSIRPTFLLPLTGMVGGDFRPEEIEAVAAQADELGPGQTIVLEINSGGGYVAEWQMIRDAIYEIQKRHRMVAWVLDGTSAAASTSLCCDVIVMKSRGHFGSITTLMGGPSAPIAYQVQSARENMQPMLRKAGRSPKLGIPFKTGEAGQLSLLSYTKDPETGDVTWYQSLEGEEIMNRNGQVLGFTAPEAVHSGIAIGIADTKEELGLLLNQGGWREVGTGTKLHDDWLEVATRCKKAIAADNKERGKLGGSARDLRKQIKILKSWVRWWDRAANACMEARIPTKKQLEEMIVLLEEALDAIQRG